MKSDNLAATDAEWARLESVWRADPLTVDEEPWTPPVEADDDRGLWLGAVLLVLAVVAGFAVGRATA